MIATEQRNGIYFRGILTEPSLAGNLELYVQENNISIYNIGVKQLLKQFQTFGIFALTLTDYAFQSFMRKEQKRLNNRVNPKIEDLFEQIRPVAQRKALITYLSELNFPPLYKKSFRFLTVNDSEREFLKERALFSKTSLEHSDFILTSD